MMKVFKNNLQKKKIINIVIIIWCVLMIGMTIYCLLNGFIDLANMYLILMAWLSLYLKDVEL